MDENRISENGQMSVENQNTAELPPDIMEKVGGGVLFPQGPTRYMFCGKYCSSPYEYAEHIVEAHGDK